MTKSSNNIVKTFSGKSVPRNRTRKIKGIYYEENVDIFKINEKWYRINSSLISYDFIGKCYSLKSTLFYCASEMSPEGIIKIEQTAEYANCFFIGYLPSEEASKYSKTKFAPTKSKEPILQNSISSYHILSQGTYSKLDLVLVPANINLLDVLMPNSHLYYLDNAGGYPVLSLHPNFNSDNKQVNSLIKYAVKYLNGRYIKFAIRHGANNTNSDFLYIYNTFSSYKKISGDKNVNNFSARDLNILSNIFSNYTYGLEFETIEGFLPISALTSTGLVPLRDGSIVGMEYTTVPMSGKTDLKYIIEACLQLSTYCKYNETCSFHIHLSGTPKTEIYLMALYKLCKKLENEIFNIFPLYKKNPSLIGAGKNYCKVLPKINLDFKDLSSAKTKTEYNVIVVREFKKIFEFLSGGVELSTKWNMNTFIHPQDEGGASKWHIPARYHWVNFIPFVFNTSRRIEFRIHHATFNPTKVIGFMLLTTLISKYAENHMLEILQNDDLNISLTTIINELSLNIKGRDDNLNNELHTKLLEYIKERKKTFFEFKKENSIAPPTEMDILKEDISIFNNLFIKTNYNDILNYRRKVEKKYDPKLKYGRSGTNGLDFLRSSAVTRATASPLLTEEEINLFRVHTNTVVQNDLGILHPLTEERIVEDDPEV